MLKKFVLVFSLCLVVVIALCAKKFLSSSENDEEITLVMAEVNPEDTVVGRMDSAFKEKVEELSGGKIKIDLQFAGILGDEAHVMELIKTPHSSIQIVRGPANLSSYSGGVPVKSNLVSIPYTFKNDEHFWKFAHSPLAEEILDEPYNLGLGVKGLFFAEEGFRHYFSSQKLESVDDLKGKKMRVAGQVLTSLAESFGAVPVSVKFTDLYAALQTGQAEVGEQPLTNYISNSFTEVAPHLILDGHMLGAVSVLINADCWDSLSKNQREILKKAGVYASDYCRKIVDSANEEAIAQIKAQGVIISEVEDFSPWQDACADMRKESAAVSPELYQKILDLGK